MAVHIGDPIIHPPVTEVIRVVPAVKNLHVRTVREVMSQYVSIALLAQWTDNSIWGTKLL